MAYSVTHIDQEYGTLTCVLRLGAKTFSHVVKAKASYYVNDGRITRVEKNLTDDTNLACHDQRNNDTITTKYKMTIWWYESPKSYLIRPAYISKKTLLPKHPPPPRRMNVACATFYFGIDDLLRVYQERYYFAAAATTTAGSASSDNYCGLVMSMTENSLMAALISFLYSVLNA